MTREEAIAQLKEINREVHIYSEAVDMAIEVLEQPEIIRCRNCRWQKDQNGSTAWLPCRESVTPPDFYCGRAERRTDE